MVKTDLFVDMPRVTPFFSESWYPLPAVIVLPGGGYAMHADHEGEPVARFYQQKGFHAFVLKYRILPETYPAALEDVQALVRFLRSNAKELNVDPQRVFVAGFSAGGHLAALSAVSEDVRDGFSARPNGVILGYPVVSSRQRCVRNFCGGDEALAEAISVEKRVTPETPPVFLWHTAEDAAVDVRQSLALGSALREQGIPFEMHIFPHGPHGLGLGKLTQDVSGWPQMSVDWIIRNFLSGEKRG